MFFFKILSFFEHMFRSASVLPLQEANVISSLSLTLLISTTFMNSCSFTTVHTPIPFLNHHNLFLLDHENRTFSSLSHFLVLKMSNILFNSFHKTFISFFNCFHSMFKPTSQSKNLIFYLYFTKTIIPYMFPQFL